MYLSAGNLLLSKKNYYYITDDITLDRLGGIKYVSQCFCFYYYLENGQ